MNISFNILKNIEFIWKIYLIFLCACVAASKNVAFELHIKANRLLNHGSLIITPNCQT